VDGDDGATGSTGLTGDQGIQGIQGIQGDVGDQGIQGPIGLTGDTGLTGDQGIQGTTGDTGLTGDDGIQGIQGIQGIAGVDGDDGAAGATGPQGTAGTNGTDGDDGATGDQGIQGVKGDTGTAGTNGTDGDDGGQGIQGIQGVTGDTGANGTAGTNGTDGVDGDDGATGLTGNTGAKGDDGDQGIQGIQGTAGVDGDDGATGSTGTQGDQGIQGVAGDDGTNGTNGTQGVKGDTGDQGIQGNAGVDGDDGAAGSTGAQGDQGIQGTAGIDGDDGATGGTGLTGDQGIQGIQGVTGDTGADSTVAGPTGPTGDTGVRGAAWKSQAGAPAAFNGTNDNDGDQYLNTTNGDTYAAAFNTWILSGNIEGPAGADGAGTDILPLANTWAALNTFDAGLQSIGYSNVAISGNGSGTAAPTAAIVNDVTQTITGAGGAFGQSLPSLVEDTGTYNITNPNLFGIGGLFRALPTINLTGAGPYSAAGPYQSLGAFATINKTHAATQTFISYPVWTQTTINNTGGGTMNATEAGSYVGLTLGTNVTASQVSALTSTEPAVGAGSSIAQNMGVRVGTKAVGTYNVGYQYGTTVQTVAGNYAFDSGTSTHTVRFGGGVVKRFRDIGGSSNIILSKVDYHIMATGSGQIYLPAIATCDVGQIFVITNFSGLTRTVQLNGGSSYGKSRTIAHQDSRHFVKRSGTTWIIY